MFLNSFKTCNYLTIMINICFKIQTIDILTVQEKRHLSTEQSSLWYPRTFSEQAIAVFVKCSNLNQSVYIFSQVHLRY